MTLNLDFEYYKKNFADKCNALICNKYKNKPEHKRRSAFLNQYNLINEKPIGKKSADKWLNPNNEEAPTLETLINICIFFNVDIEYFLSEQKELNKQLANASDYLDISIDATNQIRELTQFQKRFLELLLTKCKDEFISLIVSISKFLMFSIAKPRMHQLAQNDYNVFVQKLDERYDKDATEYRSKSSLMIDCLDGIYAIETHAKESFNDNDLKTIAKEHSPVDAHTFFHNL